MLFGMTEVRKCIMGMKNNKAPGIDGLVYEILKNDQCCRILTELFNSCLRTSLLPTEWLKAVIRPIPKNRTSDLRVPLNYRGISLMPAIGKIYSALLGGRVRRFLEKHEILVNEQNGFQPNRSCVDHIFALDDLLRIRKSTKEETFCSFIDFRKAFDYVDHEYLLYKLWQNGICGSTYRSIKTMYSKPISCVNVNGMLTDWFNVNSGVRQGDTLSPTLFALFINELAERVNSAKIGIPVSYEHDQISILLYADDIVLLSTTWEGAQSQLDILSDWCRR